MDIPSTTDQYLTGGNHTTTGFDVARISKRALSSFPLLPRALTLPKRLKICAQIFQPHIPHLRSHPALFFQHSLSFVDPLLRHTLIRYYAGGLILPCTRICFKIDMTKKRGSGTSSHKHRGSRSPQSHFPSTQPGSQPRGRVPSLILQSRRRTASFPSDCRRVTISPTHHKAANAAAGPARDQAAEPMESGRPPISRELDIPPIDIAQCHWTGILVGREVNA